MDSDDLVTGDVSCEPPHPVRARPNVNDFDLLTLADAAQLLRCSKAHVANAVAGRVAGCPAIPAVSLGRRRLIRRQSLLTWLELNEGKLASATIPLSPKRGTRKRA